MHGQIAQPVGAATFIGREVERAAVVDLVTDARVVTLTGSGGCGKTRLAMAVLEDLASHFTDAVRWVDLQGLTDPGLVTAALAASLDDHDRAVAADAPALAELIGSRHLLVVLDNCEHLVASCAAVVSSLLSQCPDLHFLTTSRVPLLVPGETTFEVSPLAVPVEGATTAAVAAAPSVQLFVERAKEVVADFRLDDASSPVVAEICRRVDGIPLAVELAAARVRLLAPQQIASGLADGFGLLTGGLRGAPARQKTLEASLDWSYRLLDDAQRLALARLSVFAGSFELDAAEAVLAGGGIDAGDALELVGALVEQSLVHVVARRSRARYRLLETIRAYARQRLAELDEETAAIRSRHLRFYVGLAHDAHAGITGADPEPWMTRLTADVDDLRAAMDWSAASGDAAALVDLTEPIDRFWFDRGAAEVAQRLVAMAQRDDIADGQRARGLVTAALGALASGELVEAHRSAGRAVEAAHAAGDARSEALGRAVRAQSGALTGRSTGEEVDTDVVEAVELAERCGDPAMLAYVLAMGGWTRLRSSTIAAACRLLERAIQVCEEASFPFHLPAAHSVLGLWPVWTGRLDESRSHAGSGRVLAEQVGRPGWTSVGWTGLGAADVLQGRHDSARSRLAQAQADAVRGPYRDEFLRPWIAFAAYARHDFDAATGIAEENIDVGRARGSRWDQALGEWILGSIALHRGETEDARTHLESGKALSSAPRLAFTWGSSVLGLAEVARRREEHTHAWELAHDALEALDEYGDRVGTADALETIADLAAVLGDSERSLRLHAAAQRFRDEAGIARWPHCEQRCRRDVEARPVLAGGDEFASVRAADVLTLAEAVSYARRGRGARRRPSSGWDSLTPAEQDVVALVAEGHSNTDIGRSLFISVNTVKKHLSHVYDKLEVEGRADLAAQAARRERHPPRSVGDHPAG